MTVKDQNCQPMDQNQLFVKMKSLLCLNMLYDV